MKTGRVLADYIIGVCLKQVKSGRNGGQRKPWEQLSDLVEEEDRDNSGNS
jgi:hypothetical protein